MTTNQSTELKAKKILSEVFGISENEITAETSSSNVEAWDSLQHLNWIAALEQEFDVMFTDEQLTRIKSFGDTLKVLGEVRK